MPYQYWEYSFFARLVVSFAGVGFAASGINNSHLVKEAYGMRGLAQARGIKLQNAYRKAH
jgi:hypothetical protein